MYLNRGESKIGFRNRKLTENHYAMPLRVMLYDALGYLKEAEVFSDYRMNLLQVRESGIYHFDNEDIQTVFEVSEHIFKKKFDEIEKKYESRNIKAELAVVIGTITESDYIIEQTLEKKGGVLNMCNALNELEQRGIEKGIEQGMQRERQEIILQMLKKDMDKTLIREITGADAEVIEKIHKEIQM